MFNREESLLHLEFIQNIIIRMGQNSFLVKGWSVTLLTAFITLLLFNIESMESNLKCLFILYLIINFSFWIIDAYYLHIERKFRGIYNDVVTNLQMNSYERIQLFEMPLDKYIGGKYSFIKVFFSLSVWPVYLPVFVFLIILSIIS